MNRSRLGVISKVVSVVVLIVGFFAAAQRSFCSDYLSVRGSRIYDERGYERYLTGVNWFGFETNQYVFHGIWTRNMYAMLNDVANLNFNVLRIPLSSEFIKKVRTGQTVNPGSIDYSQNPDLRNKTSIEILDIAINYCGQIGLKVILDMHRTPANQQTELWYDTNISEEDWKLNWEWLAQRYGNNDTVIGADIFNEPHATARWDGSNSAVDWHRAAQSCGNRILSVCPNWLIIVEGVETNDGATWSWWGANLRGVNSIPVVLNKPEKLVYSPHEYGPNIYNQWWFHNGSFTYDSLLNEHWYPTWLYIYDSPNAKPLMIGEWGGKEYDSTSASGRWFNAVVQLVINRKLNHTFWCMNPNSGDTGGIWLDDWTTIDWGKYNTISPTLFGNGLDQEVGLGGRPTWPEGNIASASSFDTPGLEPFRAIDNDPNTRWSSEFSDNQWIIVDYRVANAFDRVQIRWEAAYSRVYNVQLSNDKVNWTTVYTESNGDGGLDILNVGQQSARYLKVNCVTRGTAWGSSIYEIETIQSQPIVPAPSIDPVPAWSTVENQRITVSGSAQPNVAVIPYIEITGIGQWAQPEVTADSSGRFVAYADVNGPDKTVFKVYAKARDSQGNMSSSSNIQTVTKDIYAPIVVIVSPTDGYTTSSEVVITYTASDNIDTSVDVTFSPPGPYVNPGYYSVTATARDDAGWTAADNVNFTITPPAGPNLALNKSATASSKESTAYSASKVVDGNMGTRWASNWSDPQWIRVDLGASTNISRVVLKWESAYGKSYKIQTSNDNKIWTDVFATTDGDGGTDVITFPLRSARYVRMYGTERGTTYGYSLWEFEIYQ